MGYDRNNPHILVVENDDIYRRWLSFALKQAGFVVEACGEYEEASELADDPQRAVNLMLLDLWPSYQSAYASGQRLREKYSKAKRLFMSVQTLDQLKLEGVDVDSDVFLQKPCPRQELVRRLRELL